MKRIQTISFLVLVSVLNLHGGALQTLENPIDYNQDKKDFERELKGWSFALQWPGYATNATPNQRALRTVIFNALQKKAEDRIAFARGQEQLVQTLKENPLFDPRHINNIIVVLQTPANKNAYLNALEYFYNPDYTADVKKQTFEHLLHTLNLEDINTRALALYIRDNPNLFKVLLSDPLTAPKSRSIIEASAETSQDSFWLDVYNSLFPDNLINAQEWEARKKAERDQAMENYRFTLKKIKTDIRDKFTDVEEAVINKSIDEIFSAPEYALQEAADSIGVIRAKTLAVAETNIDNLVAKYPDKFPKKVEGTEETVKKE